MAYIALQPGEKYQFILNSIITLREEMKLTKTKSFLLKNRKQIISLQVKFSLCSKTKIHYVAKFLYIAKISLLQ